MLVSPSDSLVLFFMGRASRRKKEKLLSIPKKPAREKPKGFAPVLPDDFFDDIFYEDDDSFDPSGYGEDNYFLKFLRIPENATLNLPDNELFAACVCDGTAEGSPIWLSAFKGSLDECIKCLTPVIAMKYDEQLRGLGLEPTEWEAKHQEHFERIKQECRTQGEAKVEWFWFITSKQREPSFFKEPILIEEIS
jgi:hypothetical protein